MKRRVLYIITAVALLSGCENDSVSGLRSCPIGQKLLYGQCYNENECVPGCNSETQKCDHGKCIGKNECDSTCDLETHKCVEGNCIGLDECYPPCNEDNEICNAGTCEIKDPTLCEGIYCKNKTTYCDDTGHWKTCDPGYGCHLGYCIQGLAPECEGDICNEDNTKRCDGGIWVSCGSLETCEDGICTISEEMDCETGTCSEDGNYRCTDEGTFEACPEGLTCENGDCTQDIDKNELLWQLCTTNSECPHGICVFDISTSRTMSVAELGLKNVDIIPISMLDTRIPQGTGVCAQDCTRDASICDTISNNLQQFSCPSFSSADYLKQYGQRT